MTNLQRRLLRLCLLFLLAAAVIRLLAYAAWISMNILQMDFAAFYTAGQAQGAGLSPFLNHVGTHPDIWDGVNFTLHSKFLYPPLAASLFQPLAQLPYITAKILWTGLSILGAAGTFLLLVKSASLRLGVFGVLLSGLFFTGFHPLLVNLERGQVNTITLLLLTAAFIYLSTGEQRKGLGAGLLLAAATVLKLHVVYFLPFLLLRRKWTAAVGYAAGGVILLMTSMLVNGPEALVAYAREELPRISANGMYIGKFGRELKILDGDLTESLPEKPEGGAAKDGRVYQPAGFRFESNASLVRLIASPERQTQPSTALYSLGVLAVGAALCLAPLRGVPPGSLSQTGQLLYWQTAAAIVLLAAPLTWVMDVVWLLPVGPLLYHYFSTLKDQKTILPLLLSVLGAVLVWMPDQHGLPLLLPALTGLLVYKYIIGELLLVIGLLWLVRVQASTANPVPTGATG